MSTPDRVDKRANHANEKGCTVSLYVACFLAPIAIMLLVFACVGVYPFGTISPVFEDQYYQYLDLYQWMERVLTGDANLLYSFEKSLGGNMLATYTYYVASPTSLLLPLFGADHLLDYVVFIRCLHTGLAGLTLAAFVRFRFHTGGLSTFALAMGYALCQYQLVQACNAMWLDAVWLLPLVALGIFRLIREGRTILFFVTLVITILSSWYTGYMVVIASIIIAVVELMLFSFEKCGKLFDATTWKRPIGTFILTMVLVAFAVCICLLPTVEGLISGKAATDDTASSAQSIGTLLFYPWTLLGSGLFPASYQFNWSGPQFFCGTATLLLLVLGVVSSRIPGKIKALFGVVLAALLLCTIVSYLDSAWTGFSRGLNYYCRWSFVLEFMLIFAAGYTVADLKMERSSRKKTAAAVYAVLILIALALGAFQPDSASGADFTLVFFFTYLLIACGIILCGAVILGKTASANIRHTGTAAAGALLCLLICLDMGVNAYTVVHADGTWAKTTPDTETLSDYRNAKADALDTLAGKTVATDSDYREVYRTEFLSGLTSTVHPQSVFPTNESLAFGYMPFSQYVSTNDSAPARFFMDMGYSTRPDICSQSDEFHTTYSSPQLAADALLGLKYVEAQQKPAGYRDTGLSALAGTMWYENPYTLPLGYAVADSAKTTLEDSGNPFEYQNALFSSLCGRDTVIYVPVDSTRVSSEASAVTWEVSGYSPDDLVYGYASSQTLYRSNAILHAGDTDYVYFTRFDNGIRNIALTGDTTKVRLEADSAGADDTLSFSAYRLDREALDAALAQLRNGAVDFEAFEDGYVKAHYSGSEDTLVMFSFPFDAGWSVTVNGNEVTPEKVDDVFMAVRVPAGDAVIEMHYISPGLVPGALLGAIGVVAFIAWTVLRTRKRQAEEKPAASPTSR